MPEYLLFKEIIALSVANTWDQARLEWSLQEIYFSEEPQTCLCGHVPIIEICTIGNKLSDNCTEVGNCCVKMFLGLPSDLIFQGVKRIEAFEKLHRDTGGKPVSRWSFPSASIQKALILFAGTAFSALPS